MSIPIISRLRSKLVVSVSAMRRLYFIHVWQMDIGERCRISLSAKLDRTNPRGVHIGRNTAVAFRSAIITHDFINGTHRDVRIGENCLIGAGSVIMPGVTIGDDCVVSPNTVVMQDVPALSVVVGNPARIVQGNIVRGPWGTRRSSAGSR